jgi:hypothetical protein
MNIDAITGVVDRLVKCVGFAAEIFSNGLV